MLPYPVMNRLAHALAIYAKTALKRANRANLNAIPRNGQGNAGYQGINW